MLWSYLSLLSLPLLPLTLHFPQDNSRIIGEQELWSWILRNVSSVSTPSHTVAHLNLNEFLIDHIIFLCSEARWKKINQFP